MSVPYSLLPAALLPSILIIFSYRNLYYVISINSDFLSAKVQIFMQTEIMPHVKPYFQPSFLDRTFANKNTMKPRTRQPISYSLVELMPNAKGSALFITDSSKIFKYDMDITLHFNLTTESRWEKYLALRQDAISIEHFLATQYISRELLEVLRWEVQASQYRTPSHKALCRVLRSIELRCLQSPTPMQAIHKEHAALFSLVNTIIESPTDFPEWHNSTTAQLYSPPVFENKKSSNGFWF